MEQHQDKESVIIIGAGAGGVALAARLAKAGMKVTVVEKNEFTGGRCSLIHHSGYRFDQGPSLFLLPQLFQQTFADLDTTLADSGVELLRCKTNYNVWFHDGACFRHTSDLASMRREIEKWEGPGGFERWMNWLREAHHHYEISVREVLGKNFERVWDMARPSFLGNILRMHPFESVWARAGRYFYTERLRRVFTFATMYMGMSPFDAPATYSLLQYTEFAEGIWYPKGGFHTVIDSLVKIGREYGVEYRMSSPVKKVMTSSDYKRATGVLLESGDALKADIVVANADLVYAYSNLMPETDKMKACGKRLQSQRTSCSSISFYWALDRKISQLSTHNIFLAEEYRESFDSIFAKNSLPDEPSFYVNVPSRIDPTAAPEGCDAVIVLVPIGHLGRSKGSDGVGSDKDQSILQKEWQETVSRARTEILSIINKRINPSQPLEQCITHEIVNDPLSWEHKFNLDKGAILGLSHNFFNVLWFRPQTRSPDMEGMYFVGASTHPGTGVPIVMAGAKITAEQILGDLGMRAPWRESGSSLKRAVLSGFMDENSYSWIKFGTEELTWMVMILVIGVLIMYILPGHATQRLFN